MVYIAALAAYIPMAIEVRTLVRYTCTYSCDNFCVYVHHLLLASSGGCSTPWLCCVQSHVVLALGTLTAVAVPWNIHLHPCGIC